MPAPAATAARLGWDQVAAWRAARHHLEERSLVKTWAMRGTLHLLPAAKFPMWQAALSTRRLWEPGPGSA
jgi:Winged helix DNA-binding domain